MTFESLLEIAETYIDFAGETSPVDAYKIATK